MGWESEKCLAASDLVRGGAPSATSYEWPPRRPRRRVRQPTAFDDLCDELFASLSRQDQRLHARDYLRGLLYAPGRKTIRNIARFIGGAGVDQRLHHFISDSSWDWDEVRRALNRHITHSIEPDAWVVSPVMIPKAGLHVVGVSMCFCRIRRRTMSAQRAVGVMATSAADTFPVSWRLLMPREWVDDHRRCARSALPERIGTESLSECAQRALSGVQQQAGGAALPVVIDGRDMEYAQLKIIGLGEGPMLLRIPPNIPLRVNDPGLVGHRPEVQLAARQITEAARSRRRLVTYSSGSEGSRRQIVSIVDVLSTSPERSSVPLRLMSVSPFAEHTDDQLWLTNIAGVPTGTLLNMTDRLAQVTHDLEVIAEHRGIWDFSGRSYPGWHRHVTLASAAHAVQALVPGSVREGRVAA